jgi:biotin carboxylase
MSAIIIANCSPVKKYAEDDYPSIVLSLGLKPIFMYDADYSDNDIVNLHGKPSLYQEVVKYSSKHRISILDQLKVMDLVAIIPYTEDDVMDAEFFSDSLGLVSNLGSTSICRRDKYEMQSRIKQHGLTSIQQYTCASVQDICDFVKKCSSSKYVIKPSNGAASEDVYLCTTLDELETKFHQMINKKNNCDLVNETCLVQEYIDGEDWIVNTVSRNGVHKIVNVMRSYKSKINGRDFMYLETRLMDPAEVPVELCIYALNVLNALDFRCGAGHAEIKMSSNGPCLIEIGARVGGAQNEVALSRCIQYGYTPIKTAIYSYCSQSEFNKIPLIYSMTQEKYQCITINNVHGAFIWKTKYLTHLLEMLGSIVHVHKINCTYKDGELASKTQDLLTTIGRIFITSESSYSLQTSLCLVKEWEINLGNCII